jgi:exonuclease SbcD
MAEFKFIHAADCHLDSPLAGLERYEGAPVDVIRNASRGAFEGLIQLALDKEVTLVLLAGDLYDGDWRDFNTGLFFAGQLARLGEAGIQVFLVAGNHDAASQITQSLQLPPNVTRFDTKRPQTVMLDEPGIAIHGQGFDKPAVTDDLSAGYPEPVRGRFNIGLLHTSLTGRPGHAPYAPCTVEGLSARGYDYWALGHVHSREVVSTDPYIVFPGCLQGRHARESGAKGCTLVTVSDGAVVALDHHDVDVLRWSLCEVDLTDVTTTERLTDRIEEALRQEVEAAGGRTVAMRVRLTGATPLDSALRADPDAWVEQVRAVAARLVRNDIWVEKVKMETRGVRSLEDAVAGDLPSAELLRAIAELGRSPADVPGAQEEALRLKKALAATKLGAWMESPEGFDPADPERLGDLIDQAKQLLLSRLLVTGAGE